MDSARNKVITFPRLLSLYLSFFFYVCEPHSRSQRASLLFACQPADFLPPSREAQRCILLTRTCVVPRSRKHLAVLLLRFDAVYFFFLYLSIRTTPMQLKLHYVWGWKTTRNAKGRKRIQQTELRKMRLSINLPFVSSEISHSRDRIMLNKELREEWFIERYSF